MPGAPPSATWPGRGSVRTWLLSIVHHRSIDAVRRRRPASELPAEVEGQRTPEPLTMPDVWGDVAQRLDRETVAAALATLPEVQRETIELAYFGGLTQQEIASRTGVPLGTVKGRVRLGLASLRRRARGRGAGGLAMTERPVLDHEAVRDLAGLYALGALEPDEAAAVREHLAACALGHPEIDEAGAVAGALLETVEPVEPPAALKGRLMAAAEADLREGRHPSVAAVRGGHGRTDGAPRRRPDPRLVVGSRLARRRAVAARPPLDVAGRGGRAGPGRGAGCLERRAAGAARRRRGVPAGGRGGAPAGLDARDRRPRSSPARTARSPGWPWWAPTARSCSRCAASPRRPGARSTRRGRSARTACRSTSASSRPRPTAPRPPRPGGAAAGDVLALTLEPGAGATTPTMPIVASGTAEPVAG